MTKKVQFREVEVGETFVFEGGLFWKLNPSTCYTADVEEGIYLANAVNLTTMVVAGFLPDEEVEIVFY